MSADERLDAMRAYRAGDTIDEIASRTCRGRNAVYRAIVEERLGQLLRRKVKFIDDPLYHQPDAAEVVEQIVSQEELPATVKGEEARIPRDLPAYLQDLYRTPLLSRGREGALFLKLNFHKFQFVMARRKTEPQYARVRDLKRLEEIRRRIVHAKNQIVRAESAARRQRRAQTSAARTFPDGIDQRGKPDVDPARSIRSTRTRGTDSARMRHSP